MSQSYSIKIFVPDGDPNGVRTIEKSNWNGAGIVIPRILMAATKGRKELQQTGLYVLVGSLEESGLPRIYIGEGDPIKNRLDQHLTNKDFWNHCIAFTSKDSNLNKAHVQYIESQLIATAKKTRLCVLDNKNSPTLPTLSEADSSEAAGFLSEMMLCFPLLGLGVFASEETQHHQTPLFYLRSKGLEAQGRESSAGFTVIRGSKALKAATPSCPSSLIQLRTALVSNGVLAEAENYFEFTQDYLFLSPSTAAAVVAARSSNGRTEWKTKDGQTLRDYQASTNNG